MSERGHAIVLIGFMGAGKSACGAELAARSGLPCFDTDAIVEEHFGLPIAEIFAAHGEEAFRDAESVALKKIPRGRAVVVSGGGVVLRPANALFLRQLGLVVHLWADEDTTFARIGHATTRPLLQTPDPRQTLAALWKKRAPLYRALADISIDTTTLRPDEVAACILAELEPLTSRS